MKKFKYLICMLLLLVVSPIFFVACDNKELADLKNKYETLETEKNTLETSLATIQEQYNASVLARQALENEIEDLEDELETKNSTITLNNTTILGLESQIDELEETQNGLLESIASLEQDKKDLFAQKEEAEAEVSAKDSRIVELNAEISEKETAIQTLEEQKQSLQNELSEKKTENADLKEEIATLTTTVQEKEEARIQLTQRIAELETELAELNAENNELKEENDSLKETTSAMVIYQGETFANVVPEDNDEIIQTPILEEDKTYMFVNCTFTDGLTSTAEGIDARFYNCTFNSDGEKSLYLTSFINLEVVGCTFQTELGDLSWSTANYGIDLDIYNTTVQNITISYNNFEGLTNESSATNPCVAISIKVRLGENDNPIGTFWEDKTEGSILGTVTIEGNHFAETNNNIYLGTNPKGGDTEANLSSGAFDVVVRNTNPRPTATGVKVYERYLYEKDVTIDQVPAQVVEVGNSGEFGNKTSIPVEPTE